MLFFRITRDVTRAAARSGGQRKPSQPRQKSGIPWPALILAGVIAALAMEPLEAHGMSRGQAFLIVFPGWFLLSAVFAAIGMAMKGGGTSSPAAEIRAAHAKQARAKQPRLPAEMEAADEEARAWKAAHPEMFDKSSNERTER